MCVLPYQVERCQSKVTHVDVPCADVHTHIRQLQVVVSDALAMHKLQRRPDLQRLRGAHSEDINGSWTITASNDGHSDDTVTYRQQNQVLAQPSIPGHQRLQVGFITLHQDVLPHQHNKHARTHKTPSICVASTTSTAVRTG